MAQSLRNRSPIRLGVVPTHLKFAGGVAPTETGDLPRDEAGQIKMVSYFQQLVADSPVEIDCAQISQFSGVADDVTSELVTGLKALGLEVQFVMMVGEGDPMNPADEDKVVRLLVDGLENAKKHGVRQVASTSLEAWMSGGTSKTGSELDAAVKQLVRLHQRAYQEAKVEGSCIEAWQLEFLRSVEFQTFTDLSTTWDLVKAMNASAGKPFYKLLVDAAHCGDSSISVEENQRLIAEIAAAGALGSFHCSAKTTRGCLSTDDGWIGALLSAAAQTGELTHVLVEVFHHEDPALEPLREAVAGHGVDTTDGRSYDQVVIDGLVDTVRRLNNLCQRGFLTRHKLAAFESNLAASVAATILVLRMGRRAGHGMPETQRI